MAPASDTVATSADVEALLRYAELTYKAIADQRRRVAIVALCFVAVFGLLAAVATWRWLDTRSQVDLVRDENLVEIEQLGVSLPDPRPPVERGVLRVKAFGYAVAAVTSSGMALLGLSLWALARPPSTPPPPPLAAVRPPLTARAGRRSQPPM